MIGPVAPPTGGMTVSLDNLVTSALKDKYDFHVLDITGYMVRTGSLNIFLIAYHQLRHLFGLISILMTKKPRIVHVHMTTAFYFYRRGVDIVICKLFGKKVIIHLHGGRFADFYRKSFVLGKWTIRSVLGLSDKIIVLSDYWKDFLSAVIDAEKVSVVPNGVKLSEFRLEKDKKDELGIPKDKKLVLFMGPIGRRKGAFDMVDVVSAVVSKAEDTFFVFCGQGEYKGEVDQFRRLVEEKNVSSHVNYAGNVTGQEKYNYYLSSDIFVLPSYVENLPISLLEAMAAGLPAIASDVGMIPELVQDGVNGFIIKAGDVTAIAERIIKLAQDKDLRISMGKRNLELVKERYDMPMMADKIDRIYKELLGV